MYSGKNVFQTEVSLKIERKNREEFPLRGSESIVNLSPGSAAEQPQKKNSIRCMLTSNYG